MVPLDGTAAAEGALPLARELADEWRASIWLVHVVSHFPVTEFARTAVDPDAVTDDVACRAAQVYLDRIAARLEGRAHTHVFAGSPTEELRFGATAWSITDVVLSGDGGAGHTHPAGRVVDGLLHHLDLPLIVVPALGNAHPARNTGAKREDAFES